MHINRPGYHFLASTGPLKRYFTEFDLSDEPLIQIDPDETVYPRSPVEMTMILRPAAQVEVSVVDTAGRPVKPLNIAARWVELHPEEASPVGYCGCCDENWASGVFMPETVQRNQPRSVWLPAAAPGLPPEQVRPALAAYAEQRTEPVVSFYFSQFRPGVSRRFAIYTQPKASEPDAISNAVSLPTAGRYRLQLTWNPDAPPDQQLLAKATPGARIDLAVWGPPRDNPWMMEMMGVVRALVDVPPADPRAPGPFAFSDLAYLGEVLGAGGFRSIDVEAYVGQQAIGGPGTEPEEAARFVLSSLGVGRLLEEQEPAIRAEGAEDMLSLFKRHHMPGKGVMMGCKVWLVSAKA